MSAKNFRLCFLPCWRFIGEVHQWLDGPCADPELAAPYIAVFRYAILVGRVGRGQTCVDIDQIARNVTCGRIWPGMISTFECMDTPFFLLFCSLPRLVCSFPHSSPWHSREWVCHNKCKLLRLSFRCCSCVLAASVFVDRRCNPTFEIILGYLLMPQLAAETVAGVISPARYFPC